MHCSPTLPIPDHFNGIFFVTLRLRDALPESFGQNLGLQYYSKQLESTRFSKPEILLNTARKRLFARFDQALDHWNCGQIQLSNPALTKILLEDLDQSTRDSCKLLTCKILPNHLHLLLHFQGEIPTTMPLEEYDQIQFPPLRNFVARFQNNTTKGLKEALGQNHDAFNPSTFQKRQANGIIQMEGEIWHPRSFDFQIQDADTFEKVVQYIQQNPNPTQP